MAQCIEFGYVVLESLDGLCIAPFAGAIFHPIGINEGMFPFSGKV
jgi:hypothetical protein